MKLAMVASSSTLGGSQPWNDIQEEDSQTNNSQQQNGHHDSNKNDKVRGKKIFAMCFYHVF